VHWSVYTLTHSRYLRSANKVRRSVYTSTQRRHLITYYSYALSSSGRIYRVVYCRDDLKVNPCVYIDASSVYTTTSAPPRALTFKSYLRLQHPMGCTDASSEDHLHPATSTSLYVKCLPTSGSQSTYWWPVVYLLVALSLPTGGSQSTYWWLSVYLLVALSLHKSCPHFREQYVNKSVSPSFRTFLRLFYIK
jgi:hypothetical protein